MIRRLLALSCLAAAVSASDAPPPPAVNSGDNAWVLMSAVLVLFMTIPGLALFYGGLVRAKNVLTIIVQCFAVTGVITVLWLAYGWSLAFGQPAGLTAETAGIHAFIGDGSRLFLAGLKPESMWGANLPETTVILFQLTFAIITPALLVGAFAERLRFGAVLALCVGWFTLAYLPICHMAWGGAGSLFGSQWGLLDMAGGTVVEINSGFAGLACAIAAGRRAGYPHNPVLPHNLVLCCVGAAMLWVGWFGFNAGSALAANASAGWTALNTMIAGGAAVTTWMAVEWLRHGKPSALGVATAAVAGLVGITPGCAFVGPLGALAIGAIAALGSYLAVMVLKPKLGYDDSLDVFGVHGVAGLIGTLLTGVFGVVALGGIVDQPLGTQLWAQTKASLVTAGWSFSVAFGLMKLIDLAVGLRAPKDDEYGGLDVAQHGEAAYNH